MGVLPAYTGPLAVTDFPQNCPCSCGTGHVLLQPIGHKGPWLSCFWGRKGQQNPRSVWMQMGTLLL